MSCNVLCKPHCQFVVSVAPAWPGAFGLFKTLTFLWTNLYEKIFGVLTLPQCLSGNAVFGQMPGGSSFPTGMFCASRGRQRTWGKSDFFDSAGVLRPFWRLRAKFFRISLIRRKTRFSG